MSYPIEHLNATVTQCPFQPFVEPQLTDPSPFFAQMRQEQPIFRYEQGALRAWVVTRYADVLTMLRAPNLFSNRDTILPVVNIDQQAWQIIAQSPHQFVPIHVNSDGAEHRRLRTPLEAAFAPPRVRALTPFIRERAQSLVHRMLTKQEREAEFLTDFAAPLTLEVILSIFGVPAEDVRQVKAMCDDHLALYFRPLPLAEQVRCAHSAVQFIAYCADQLAQRRREPQEDLLTDLVIAVENGSLTLDEAITTVGGTFIAGYETTYHLLGAAIRLLSQDAECWQSLRSQPDRIHVALDEVLRYATSIPYFIRTVLADTTLGGVEMRAGDLVLLAFLSANRDEQQFANADHFDIEREPNRHLSFGRGIHYCLGAPLARLEGQIALETLTELIPTLHVKPGPLHSLPSLRIRGVETLPVQW